MVSKLQLSVQAKSSHSRYFTAERRSIWKKDYIPAGIEIQREPKKRPAGTGLAGRFGFSAVVNSRA
jgi:hypothetical protein